MAFACNGEHTVMVSEEGKAVFACGYGEHGQLGRATPIGCRRMCQGLRQLLQLAWLRWPSEHHHSSASTLEGESLTLGGGILGQLGLVDRECRTMPSKLGREAFGGSAVTMVSCGVRHTMVMREAGKLFITFRQESWGQLGHSDTNDPDVPVEVGAAALPRR